MASSFRKNNGSHKQPLHSPRETLIPSLNSVLAISELMSQANLPFFCMTFLGTIKIRDPIHRAVVSHNISDDLSPTTWTNHMQHNLVILKDPFPLILSIYPRTCFIGAYHPRRLNTIENSLHMGIKSRVKALKNIGKTPLADRKPKYVLQHFDQSLVAYMMAITHVGYEPLNTSAKR